MKSIFILILSFFMFSLMTAQGVHIYEIQPDGTKGKLLRVEDYENKQLIKTSQYDENKQLEFVVSKRYNSKNQLIKEVKTLKKEHEYDLITEYYYDSEERKSGTLKGNNLNGKWYSERYIYNANNDLDTVFYYQKNGDLTSLLVHQYEYDSQKRKVKLIRKKMDTEMDEEISRNIFFYEYNTSNLNEKITEKDENGIIVCEEWKTNTLDGKPKSIEYQMQDFPKFKTVYFYNSNNQPSKKVEYIDGKLSITTFYKYNSKGKVIQEKSKTTNGYYGEIYVY